MSKERGRSFSDQNQKEIEITDNKSAFLDEFRDVFIKSRNRNQKARFVISKSPR